MQRILTLLALVLVSALLMNGCSDSDNPTNPGTTNEDLTPPTAPVSLTVHVEDNVITLAWMENSEVDLDGYHVYRSTNDSSYDIAGELDSARFEDMVPGQGVWHVAYRVTALLPGARTTITEKNGAAVLPWDTAAPTHVSITARRARSTKDNGPTEKPHGA